MQFVHSIALLFIAKIIYPEHQLNQTNGTNAIDFATCILLQELLLDELVARSATGMLQEGRKTLLYKDVGMQPLATSSSLR